VLKLRKVELFGFKSFADKTPITFSGTGITCIVGPNGCGKSNVVDAISWVLGEQSKKMLRAENMSDCIFNGTAKRPPMGLSEVSLTLVDPELIEAAKKVAAAPAAMDEGSETAEAGAEPGPVVVAETANEMVLELDEAAGPVILDPITHVTGEVTTTVEDGFVVVTSSAEYSTDVNGETGEVAADTGMDTPVQITAEADAHDAASDSAIVTDSLPAHKFKKKRSTEKPAALTMKVGEVVVGRRLYRSGQSEYVINGRVARLRDVQELFSGLGLGPDSYAIIEQGRIGLILNSKPMDRRAIIEEAAGITMYKTKRRLAEAKLEASKVNLSRIHDILVEVEKQLASLKRQASKARRYAELREQMRGSLRIVLASKAQHLDIEAVRLENLLREMETVESRDAIAVHELEGEQERLSNRSYELDEELRQTQNLLSQAALELDRAENRITFNQEQVAQISSREMRVGIELEQAQRIAADLSTRMAAHREAVVALREQTATLETNLREGAEQAAAAVAEQARLDGRIAELRTLSARLGEDSARQHAESLQADEAAARHTAAEEQRSEAMRAVEVECAQLAEKVSMGEATFTEAETLAQTLGVTVRESQASLAEQRKNHQEAAAQLEKMREMLSGERARQASIEKILSERAYTADAVQKLFSGHANGDAGGGTANDFRAVGLLADYAEVQEQYEAAIEQFLREELEYVVVESFDQARAGVALLRDEMGGRATFFVDSLNKLNLSITEADASLPLPEGVLGRLDRLVEFREPLGAAAKHFLTRLRTAYVVENADVAQQLAFENPHSYYLTPEGTTYHGRMVSGGRAGEAGPLALKREMRQHESEVAKLENAVSTRQVEMARIDGDIAAGEIAVTAAIAQQMEAEKSLVAARLQRDQSRAELKRIETQFAADREEITRLRQQAQTARERAEKARAEHTEAMRSREAAEMESAHANETLVRLRAEHQAMQESVVARREELAMISERLTSAETAEGRLTEEIAMAMERVNTLATQRETMTEEKAELETSCAQLSLQAEELGKEKTRLTELKAAQEVEWEASRTRMSFVDEEVRTKRTSLEELRAERSQRQIEKARSDADRDYLRQTCVAELNAQPEELIMQEPALLVGEDLVAAETNYNEMKARVEAMGPVNMMALEEFKECEERDTFMRKEREDLVASIQNTQMTINELDTISKQKFEEAFNFINAHFAIAFQSLFGGGHGEMRMGEADSSGEAGIDIAAQPPGKRLQNILLLSGGEKALTALALLIGVFKYKPSPFCILDEVDAPLDEANVGRFNRMLREMCDKTQFIVVTHNRRTMEMGSVLYGVTMQEPGVSKMVSVKWEEAEPAAMAASASNAA
jgi:chromosome segregation protein